MNPLLWLIGGYAILGAAHYLFRPAVERIWKPDPDRITPAVAKKGVGDFEPLDAPVVAGHYYMSIAGMSPIISAIVGLYWGWLPALLWLLLGVIIMGTPTEYIHLMASLRQDGDSLGKVVEKQVGSVSGICFTVALWFMGTITYTIFISVMSKTLASIPMAGIPTLALSVIACVFGYLRRVRNFAFWPTAIICVIIWLLTIYWGIQVPLKLPVNTWLVIFVIYAILAVYLPIWLLLAPRDFLNTSIVIIGLFLASIALLVGLPTFKIPAFVGFNTARGLLWPAIFATITCGALNATHCMISAGLASKQVKNEKHSYGIVSFGTKMETVMALVSIALIAGMHDYKGFTSTVVKDIGTAFSQSFGNAMQYIGLPPEIGVTLGALTLTGFVITTMDSYARGARMCLQELSQRISVLKWLRFDLSLVSTLVIIFLGLYLTLKVPFMQLWAGFALLSLSIALYPYSLVIIDRLRQGLRWDSHFYCWIVIPGAFINVTAVAALIYFLVRFITGNQVLPAIMAAFVLALYVISAVQIATVMSRARAERARKS